MKVTFVCLANSNKEKGRCIAGIEIQDGKPRLVDGKPKWIRPVCNTLHGEIPSHLVWYVKLLDIIEINVTAQVPEGFQSENNRFDTDSIQVIGSYPASSLPALSFSTNDLIFGNNGRAVSDEEIISPAHSLMLVKITAFKIFRNTYSGNRNSQVRMRFTYRDSEYDFPVTDPVFVDRYRLDKDILANKDSIYITVSLGILFEGLHYKLVAAVFH